MVDLIVVKVPATERIIVSTPTQLASTISDFSPAVDARIAASTDIVRRTAGVQTVATIAVLTQAAYNALTTPNSSTLYLIAG